MPDALSQLEALAFRKEEILTMLADERTRQTPSEAIIAACELSLRCIHTETQRISRFTAWMDKAQPENFSPPVTERKADACLS